MMNGVLVVNKPIGMTSHDVVDSIRKILKIEKVGHAGTLDPGAGGVLIVCVGKATKLTGRFMELPKAYRGIMTLGIRTDTQDAWGRVVSQEHNPEFGRAQLLEIFSEFVGEIEQVPPMYSALKHKGKRLYSLARQGIEVERPPRKVHIISLRLLNIFGPKVEFDMECSKGTYVRTLCYDIGEKLGCGAHLACLERTKVGKFCLDDALTLEQLKVLRERNALSQVFRT